MFSSDLAKLAVTFANVDRCLLKFDDLFAIRYIVGANLVAV